MGIPLTLPKYAYIRNGEFINADFSKPGKIGAALLINNYLQTGFTDGYGEVLLLRAGENVGIYTLQGQAGTEYTYFDPYTCQFDPCSTAAFDNLFGKLRAFSWTQATGCIFFCGQPNGIIGAGYAPSEFTARYDYASRCIVSADGSKSLSMAQLMPEVCAVPADFFPHDKVSAITQDDYIISAFMLLYVAQNPDWFFGSNAGFMWSSFTQWGGLGEGLIVAGNYVDSQTGHTADYFPLRPRWYAEYFHDLYMYRPELVIAMRDAAYLATPDTVGRIRNYGAHINPVMFASDLSILVEYQNTEKAAQDLIQERQFLDSIAGVMLLIINASFAVYTLSVSLSSIMNAGSVSLKQAFSILRSSEKLLNYYDRGWNPGVVDSYRPLPAALEVVARPSVFMVPRLTPSPVAPIVAPQAITQSAMQSVAANSTPQSAPQITQSLTNASFPLLLTLSLAGALLLRGK